MNGYQTSLYKKNSKCGGVSYTWKIGRELFNNNKLCYLSWVPTPLFIRKTLPKTIDSVKNLFITGHWVWAAGSISGVIRIAHHTAQIICQNDKKKFSVREN
jgi:hypothetical protein